MKVVLKWTHALYAYDNMVLIIIYVDNRLARIYKHCQNITDELKDNTVNLNFSVYKI